MKYSRKLLILLSALAVVIAVTVIVAKSVNKNQSALAETVSVFEAPGGTVMHISTTFEDDTIRISRVNGLWVFDDYPDLYVDTDVVSKMESELEKVSVTKIQDGIDDFSPYGLAEPLVTIEAEADGGKIRIDVGDSSPIGYERYVSIGDGALYTSTEDLYYDFNNHIVDIMVTDPIPTMTDCTGLNIERGEDLIRIEKEEPTDGSKEGYHWYLIENDGRIPLDTASTDSFVSNVIALTWRKGVAYQPTPDQLKGYGLTEPQARITVRYLYTRKASAIENEIEKEEKEFIFLIGDCNDVGYYAMIEGGDTVYEIRISYAKKILNASFSSSINIG